MKYRKKPVIIEAFKWTGDETQTKDPEWMIAAILSGDAWLDKQGTPDVALYINTLEGTHKADRGDWIIRGVKGELYPCKPDIFDLTYEAV